MSSQLPSDAPRLGDRSTVQRITPTAPERHAYPQELARVVYDRWHATQDELPGQAALLEPRVVEQAISTCYQASLLQEEGRPVTFRVAFGSPETFAPGSDPRGSLYRLVFVRTRPFDEHELRRLAPAASGGMDVINEGRYVTVKYAFVDEAPRRRILDLTVEIMNELARFHGPRRVDAPVGWDEYEATHLRQLVQMDQELFDVAPLVADFTRRGDILGPGRHCAL